MTIAQKDLAIGLGVSQALVSDYVRRGMPVASVEAAREWRVANVRVRAGAAGVPPEVTAEGQTAPKALAPDYHEARALREAEEARLAQLRRMELEGELIRMEAVRIASAGVLASTRESLLQIPARMATVLAAEDSPTRIHELLQQELYQALAHLSALPDRWRAGVPVQEATL